MDSKVINCTDFGDLKIQEYTTVGQLDKYFNSAKNNPIIAVDTLISDIIVDKIETKKLTDVDKICILTILAEELEVAEFFNKQISDGANYFDAFYDAFKLSDYHQSLTKAYKGIESLIAPSLAITKMNQTFLRNYSALFSIQEAARTMSKRMNPGLYNMAKITQPYESIQKSILAYNKIMKSVQFPLTTQLLSSGIIQQQRLIAQTKTFNNIFKLSSFNLEHLRNLSAHNKNLFEPIAILSKRYSELNSVFGLTDSALLNLTRNLNYIKSTKSINWTDQLNIASKLINSSNVAIGITNDYFVDSIAIKSIFNKELELESDEIEEITESVIQSETIIQDKAGTSIIIQNEYAQLLFEKIDSLQEEQKKYKIVFDHFEQFLRPQTFSDFLDEFAGIVSREYWKQFWKVVGNTFKSAPESIAKSNLGMFLSGRFSNIAFIGQELMAGNGFIDLLINYLGINYLVELKVIGATTPISWAKSGIDQLNDYMSQYNLDKGYLVVYDGRKTERGEQLENHYDVSNGRIYVKKIKIYYAEK
jgi:hypothetical protein